MFKIGEFSTIARVSDVLLRHYDAIDLFKPGYVDPQNGYRYYHIEQLPDLNRILVLRELGFSLDEIGKMVRDNISLEEIQGMLKLKASQVEQTIEQESKRLRRIQGRLKQLQTQGTVFAYDVLVKPVEAQPFLSLSQNLGKLSEASQYYYLLPEVLRKHRVNGASYYVALFHQPFFRTEDVEWEIGVMLTEPFDGIVKLPDGRELTQGELPAADEMACVVHKGPWAEMHLGFAAIGNWLQSNHLQIDGPTREVYLNLVPPGQDENFVVEIQIPVTKKEV